MLKAQEPSGSVLFEEKQKFPRWIRWVVLVAMVATIAGMLIGLFTEKEKWEMAIGLAIVAPVIFMVLYLHSTIQLEKMVTSNGLYYRWKPWHSKFRVIEKQDISSVIVREFPLMNYGFGWFPGFGRYHNSSHGEGLQIILQNQSRVYFSTYDVVSFKKAIDTLIETTTKPVPREF